MNRMSKLFSVAGALTLVSGVAFVSQGCTVTTSNGPMGDAGDIFDSATPDATPSSATCNECLFQSCTAQWAVCQANSDCVFTYACATAPGCDQNCIDNCYASRPRGQSAYYPLAQCDSNAAYGNACAAACGTQATVGVDAGPLPPPDAGTPAPDAGVVDSGTAIDAAPADDAGVVVDASPAVDAAPVQDCTTCTTASCASAKTSCAAGTDCDKYTQCLAVCTDLPCINACGTNFPMGQTASTALSSCVTEYCATACGIMP